MNWFVSRKIKKLLKRVDMLPAFDEVAKFLSDSTPFDDIEFDYDSGRGDLFINTIRHDDVGEMARFTKPNSNRSTWRS